MVQCLQGKKDEYGEYRNTTSYVFVGHNDGTVSNGLCL